MRNHSFSSLSTAYEHEVDHLDEDSYDLNLSVSSLAKLNRRKPQISTILKLNLIVVLVISLFIKLTVVSIINGSLSAFIALKLLTHGLILYTFLKKHYISLQLLFVLDVILFVIFLLFEFLLLVSNFAIIIIQHKRNKNLGFIGIWLMILIAAIDLLILVMVAIVLENYRRPKERLQQLEAKLVTVVHNGRLLASQMCKSGSYLLGFVCNSSTAANQSTNPTQQATNNNGMLQNGTPRIYRDSENPGQRISCINTQEASSVSLNDDEYVHYSSVDMTSELGNRFHSFSDFYNFNNRNANPTNEPSSTVSCSTTNTIHTVTSNNSTTTMPSIVVTSNVSSSTISNLPTTSNSQSATLPTMLNMNLTNNLSNLNNLTHNIITTGIPSLTTLATSSTFGTSITSTQLQSSNLASNQAQAKEQSANKSLFERANPFKSINGTLTSALTNGSTSSSIISSNTNTISNSIANPTSSASNSTNVHSSIADENTYVHMYQSNVDEDGDPMDGPLKCTRTTVINNTESGPNSTSHTVVQMNRNASERLVNCKPVYI